jgi:uncharacterized protein YndB with AHSA1/START domain
MTNQVSVTVEIDAPAERVFAMVSDVTRMCEWSPENESAKWLGGATGPQPGARFRGTNRNGKKKWNTVAKIDRLEPGRAFSFHVSATGLKVAEWRYELEPTARGGCRVTETWIDERGRIVKVMGKAVSGVDDRAAHNRAGIEQTLQNLKAAAESASAPS